MRCRGEAYNRGEGAYLGCALPVLEHSVAASAHGTAAVRLGVGVGRAASANKAAKSAVPCTRWFLKHGAPLTGSLALAALDVRRSHAQQPQHEKDLAPMMDFVL